MARAGYRVARPALRRRREKLGLSGRALARRIEVPESTLWRIERKKLRASPERQKALARELGASIDELFARLELSQRDEAIVADYARLGSSIKVARKRKVSKEIVLGALHRADVATRDRTAEQAERLRRVAELDAEGVPRKEMGDHLGVSRSQIQADLRHLNRPKRPPRRKHPKPKPRVCVHPECTVVFRPDAHQAAQGWGDYHSPRCARTAPTAVERAREAAARRHRRADELLAELNGSGLLIVRQAAGELGIGENTLGRYIAQGWLQDEGLLRVENERWRVLRREEFLRFKREAFPVLVQRFAGSPSWPFRPPSVRQTWGRFLGGYTEAKATPRGAPRKYDRVDANGERVPRSRDDVLAEVRTICAANPRLGLRPVAERAHITKSQLEYLLGEEGCSLTDLRQPLS